LRGVGILGSDYTDVIAFHIGRKQDVNHDILVPCIHKVARQVFVFRVRLAESQVFDLARDKA